MEPLPYKICVDSVLGRHLVATQPIKCGTIILKESPLVRGPFLHTLPVCLGCGKTLKPENNKPCGKCGWPVCNEKCEKSDKHKPECVLTTNRGSQISIKNFGIPNPNYQFVTILRTLYLKKTNTEIWEKLMLLQSLPIDINIAPASFIKKLFKLDDWSEGEITKVSQILTVNGHELPLTNPPQLVVFDKTSFLEHACKANCTKTFTNEGEVLVVAAEDIEEDNHLSISYTDPFWGTENRRQHLYQTKQFWCSCIRCEDPTENGTHLNSIKCPTSSCTGFVLPKTFLQECQIWSCDTCDAVFPNQNVSFLLTKIGVELAEMPKNDVTPCKQFIKKYDKILAPSHFYMIDIKLALSHMLSSHNFEDLSDSDLSLLLQITVEQKLVAEKIATAERRFIGLVLYRLAKTSIEVARRGENPSEFRSVLTDSKKMFSQARLVLVNEPSLLPEGRIYRQIALELQLIDDLLNKI